MFIKHEGEIYYAPDFFQNIEDFKKLWRSRDRRDLTLYPVTNYEKFLYEVIIPGEKHLPRNKRTVVRIESRGETQPDTGHGNFAGPGTHFFPRMQGNETYINTREGKLIGRSPYDEPDDTDYIDWCACAHDLVYTNPLSSPEDIYWSNII